MLYLYMSACVADGMKSRSLGRSWKQYNSTRLLPGLIYFEKPAQTYSKYSLSELIRPVCTTICCADTPKHQTENETERTGPSFAAHSAACSEQTPDLPVSDYFLTQINRKWPTPDIKKTCKNYSCG